MRIKLKRAADGSSALTCIRADGSTTWQVQRGSLGLVFPSHDLTHYAVETSLHYSHGFYGLIASGWEIGDFTAPWPRGPIPPEAREVELVVSLFDIEMRSGERWDAAAMTDAARKYVASRTGKADVPLPVLDDESLQRTRDLRADVFARWDAIPPGGTLELTFVT